MTWLIRQYMLAKYGAVCLPKPPLGWCPWTTPPLATRLLYAVRYRIWRIDDALTKFVGGSIYPDWSHHV